MTTNTTTFSTAGGPFTFTASTVLLNNSVSLLVCGAPGGNAADGIAGGIGDAATGTVALAAGGTLNIYVGDNSGHGLHTGGTGSTRAGNGGGSSAVQTSGAVLLIEAGGGGGAGGDTTDTNGVHVNGGVGGKGALSSPGNGANGTTHLSSGTPNYGGGGGGGGGSAGNGGNAIVGTSGAGGVAPGGGGTNGGAAGAGAIGSAGGGAGNTSTISGAVSNSSNTDGGAGFGSFVQVTQTFADPPLAPTLQSPANNAYIDTNAVGVTFTWTYNPATDSGTQQAFALKISTDGGADQWWNVGTASLQGTEVYNTSASSTVTIPATKLADGHTYTWTVATQGNAGGYNLAGPYASPRFVINATAMPVATILTPTGSTSNPQPTVTWSEVLGGGDVQTAYRVVLYTQAQTLAPGFAAGLTTGVQDSGVVASASLVFTFAAPLVAGTWVVYLQITETGSVVSAWTSSTFTLAFAGPQAPVLSVVQGTAGGTSLPIANATIDASEGQFTLNQLTAVDSSFEASIGSWVDLGGVGSIAQSTTQAEDGTHSMQITGATGTNTISAITASGLSGYAVTPGVSYIGMASFFPGSTIRSVGCGIRWYDNTGTLITASNGNVISEVASTWTQTTVTGVAPVNAAFAALFISVVSVFGTAEFHYVDECGLFFYLGSTPQWNVGGTTLSAHTYLLQRSTDGGNTWTTLRNANSPALGGSSIVVPDYEPPFGPTAVQYRAFLGATTSNPNGSLVGSIASNIVSIAITATKWWLTDPLDNTIGIQFGTISQDSNFSREFDTAEESAIFYGWGNPNAIIQRGEVNAATFAITAVISGYNQLQTMMRLLGRSVLNQSLAPRQRVLLLRDPQGFSYYVYVGPTVTQQLLRAGDSAINPFYWITLDCVVTAAPAPTIPITVFAT